MIKQIGQWRSDKASGDIVFENEAVIAFGIQARPGTQFRVNDGQWIIVGSTGFYELDLQYLNATVAKLEVNRNTISSDDYVLVDYITITGMEG